MTKTIIAAAFLASLGGAAAQAGQDEGFTDSDRAFYADTQADRQLYGEPLQAPRHRGVETYQGGFGSFGGAANTARTLGY
ncbi:MAG: hypothetical protein INR64_16320 [Caulobacteraceae bacterium]|nr:hypothetical protein [Caulobacter sp.]